MSSNVFHQFVQGILLEVAIDNRVVSGVVDLTNEAHIFILAEKMFDRGIDAQVVQEVVNKLVVRDGKFPDRQAFNKEGWLVTFPTPEHRAAAIKKRTHFGSDPTHGKGGMNLYYKKKGKQSRQKQQDTSIVGSSDADNQANAPAEKDDDENQSGSEEAGDASSLPPAGNNAAQTGTAKTQSTGTASGGEAGSTGSLPPAAKTGSSGTGDQAAQGAVVKAGDSSVPVAPVAQPTKVDFVKISQDFAKEKKWTSTPYGDWRNSQGDTVAVTGLDDQVVPVKFVDREELKAFADNKPSTQ